MPGKKFCAPPKNAGKWGNAKLKTARQPSKCTNGYSNAQPAAQTATLAHPPAGHRRILENTMKRLILLPLVAVAVLAGCGTSSKTAFQSPSTVRDGVLVGPNQMTLYVFDKDAPGSGKSVCNSTCATNWPPLVAPASAAASGDWGVVARDDGSKQWAYKGRPLYFWAKDAKPGDTTGDGVMNNAWKVARP